MSKLPSILKKFLDILQPVFIALALSLVIRTYVAEARVIPTGSMIPTLQIGERVMVDHLFYQMNGLKHGDIVVFAPTKRLLAEGYKEDFIKRVIGLPGDTISVKSGKVYLNGEELKETYIREEPLSDYGPYTVPENHLFVMGDNRNESYDSRYWGPVPADKLIGRAFLRYWPVGRLEIID